MTAIIRRPYTVVNDSCFFRRFLSAALIRSIASPANICLEKNPARRGQCGATPFPWRRTRNGVQTESPSAWCVLFEDLLGFGTGIGCWSRLMSLSYHALRHAISSRSGTNAVTPLPAGAGRGKVRGRSQEHGSSAMLTRTFLERGEYRDEHAVDSP